MDARTRRVTHKARYKEPVLPRRSQGGARITYEASRTVYKVSDGRNDVGRLSFPAGYVHPLIHPYLVVVVVRIAILTELPVDAPTGVGTVY